MGSAGNLINEFAQVDEEAWRGLVQKALGGADFDDQLVSHTADNLRIEPLYPGARTPPLANVRPGAWTVMQRADDPDLNRARRQLLADLDNGATGLVLVFADSLTAGAGGLRAQTLRDMQTLLADVDVCKTLVRIDGGRFVNPLVAAFVDSIAASTGVENIAIAPCVEPLARFARRGVPNTAFDLVPDRYRRIIYGFQARGISRTLLCADLRAHHGAGASPAQELGIALATLVQYMRWCEEGGLDLATYTRAPMIIFSADADQFLVIAKLRAARLLWARLAQVVALPETPLCLHAESAVQMMAKDDPHVNILRTTLAGFAAGLGGADAVTLLPFAYALGLPDAHSRRIARNIQMILQEESHLAKVADPAAGAGVIEDLTQGLCNAGWRFFQSIEREGGLAHALKAGFVQRRITQMADKKRRQIATRAIPLVGVSHYPQPPEMRGTPIETLPLPAPAPAIEQTVDIDVSKDTWFDEMVEAIKQGTPRDAFKRPGKVSTPYPKHTSAPLVQWRDAEPFETLQRLSETIFAQTGHRPRVFLANLGPLASFSIAATYATNFFSAGGIESLTNDGFANVTGATNQDALVGTFQDKLARCACICGDDAHYAAEAVAVARALKGAGAERIFMVGACGTAEADFRAAGVDDFLFDGRDIPDTLGTVLRLYGGNPSSFPSS